MNICDKCHGFLVDFICYPLTDPLRSSVKWKKFPEVAHSLAKEFQQIFQNLGELEEYTICKHILQLTNFNQVKDHGVPDECVRGMLKLDGLLQINHTENIKQIVYIIEDAGIVYDYNIQLLWIGYCLEHLWTHLKNIHNEHSGLAPPSYSGPPVGATEKKSVIIENYFLEEYINELYI